MRLRQPGPGVRRHRRRSRPAGYSPPRFSGREGVLTYWAMSNSDDLVLLLERDAAHADDAVAIAANGAFRRASGYTNDQLVGRTVADLVPDVRDAESVMNVIRNNGSLRTELACLRADGATFMLGLHLMPAPARTPGSACFVILGRDITAALQVRQTQDLMQRLLAKVFTSVDIALAIVNSSGRIVMTNRHIEGLLGYSSSGLVGRPTLDLVAPSARARIGAVVKQQLLDGLDTVQVAPSSAPTGSN